MNDIQLKNKVTTDLPDNNEKQISASILRGLFNELIDSKMTLDKAVLFKDVADNAEMTTLITSGGFTKGVLLVESYTDTEGNVGPAIIVILGSVKLLIPTFVI